MFHNNKPGFQLKDKFKIFISSLAFALLILSCESSDKPKKDIVQNLTEGQEIPEFSLKDFGEHKLLTLAKELGCINDPVLKWSENDSVNLTGCSNNSSEDNLESLNITTKQGTPGLTVLQIVANDIQSEATPYFTFVRYENENWKRIGSSFTPGEVKLVAFLNADNTPEIITDVWKLYSSGIDGRIIIYTLRDNNPEELGIYTSYSYNEMTTGGKRIYLKTANDSVYINIKVHERTADGSFATTEETKKFSYSEFYEQVK